MRKKKQSKDINIDQYLRGYSLGYNECSLQLLFNIKEDKESIFFNNFYSKGYRDGTDDLYYLLMGALPGEIP